MYTHLAAIVLFIPVALGIWCVGGRREWSLVLLTQSLFWAGIVLHLIFIFRLYRESRHSLHDAQPVSWKDPLLAFAVVLPWIALILLGWRGTYNPSFVPLDNTLLSQILPLEHAENQPTTVNPIRSRLYLNFYAAMTIFLVGGWLTLRTRRAVRFLLALILANGAILTFLGIAAKVAGTERMLWLIESHTTSFFATIYYKNHWGGIVLLLLGAGMALALDALKRARVEERFPEVSIGCIILLFPFLLSVLMAQARASAIIAAGLALLFAGRLFRAREGQQRNRILDAGACVLVFIAVTGSLVWIASPQFERMYQRSERQIFQMIADGSMSPDARIAAYRSTLSVFQERPVWGWGAGSFAYIFPLHADESLIQDDGRPLFFEFAHNDYLQLLAEQGAAGAALVVLTPLLALLFALRYRWTVLSVWIGAGLTGVLLLAVVDFPFGNPAVTANFWLLAVAALAHRRLSTPNRNRSSTTDFRHR